MASDEWAEARTTIGRMDTALEDLRKFGFSLVTALLTASGLVGGLANNKPVLAVSSVVIVVLVLVLFGTDLYYQTVLSGAVERALDLEAASANPQLRLTKVVSDNALRTHIVEAILALYVALLLTAALLGIFGSSDAPSRGAVAAVSGAALVMMIVAWMFARGSANLSKVKSRTWPP